MIRFAFRGVIIIETKYRMALRKAIGDMKSESADAPRYKNTFETGHVNLDRASLYVLNFAADDRAISLPPARPRVAGRRKGAIPARLFGRSVPADKARP